MGGHLPIPSSSLRPYLRCDWGEAVDVSLFYGRTEELATLVQWIRRDRCRLVALLGMGGIGKTSFSVKLAQQLQGDFEVVMWRSLRNAPSLETLLGDLVPFLSDQQDTKAELGRLVHWLRASRCLVILDNGETILQGGDYVGQYRSGYENYADLFRVMGETFHQSCLILTSREKPVEIAALEGTDLPVRSLQLQGSSEVAAALIQAKRLAGSVARKQELGERYSYNPLALKIVATFIQDLFDGEIEQFLEQDTIIFNSVRRLLEQQFERLSQLEQTIMYWLAINREWTSIAELAEDIISPVSRADFLEALESLRWRSLIEKQSGKYTQQPVVMEYMTDRFTEQVTTELIKHNLSLFNRYALIKTTVKDYIRQSQFRLIANVIAHKLKAEWIYCEVIEQQIQTNLQCLRELTYPVTGYSGGNLLNLCHSLGVDLTNYDFSGLSIRHACLQQINLRQTRLLNTRFIQCLFNQNFSAILAIAFSPDDSILATGDILSQICLWRVQDGQSLMTLQGHISRIYSVAWHPDGNRLASSSDDQTIKIWDV